MPTTTALPGCTPVADEPGAKWLGQAALVYAVGPQQVWLGGNGNRFPLRFSRNGGATFDPGCFPADLHAAQLASDLEFGAGGAGVLAGSGGGGHFVLRTGDGGRTWERAAITLPPRAGGDVAVSAVGERDAWLLTSVGVGRTGFDAPPPSLFHSGDAGRRFTAQALPVVPGALGVDVDFVDPRHGWALLRQATDGRQATLLATSDGGNTWLPLPPPPPGDAPLGWYTALRFLDSATGFVVRGDTFPDGLMRSELLRTGDGGRSWETVLKLEAKGGGSMTAPSFVDPAVGFIAGTLTAGEAGVWATADGGRTWERRSQTRNVDMWSISFADSLNGYAAGAGRPCLLATSDGGVTWRRVPVYAPPDCAP